MATGSLAGIGGRTGGGIALYVEKWIEYEGMSLKSSHKKIKSLQVRIKDQDNKWNLVVGVYNRLPEHGEPIEKAFFTPATEGVMLTGSHPAGGLEPS